MRIGAALRMRYKRRFVVRIDDAHVRFVTEDRHSRVWFHSRYGPGDQHEPAVTKAIARRVASASVFADVGAHLGYFSCIAAALDARLRVFAFEMNEQLIPLIAANAAENELGNLTIVNAAVTDSPGVARYDATSLSPALSVGGHGVESSRLGSVEAVTLDAFYEDRSSPDLIKIDVEGAEMRVLQGAQAIVSTQRPTMFVEIHANRIGMFGSSADDVVAFLRDHGYSLLRMTGHRRGRDSTVPLRSVTELVGNCMVLCIPPGDQE